MNFREKLEKCFQIIDNPNASLSDIRRIKSIEVEINSELSNRSDEEKKKIIEENSDILNNIADRVRQVVSELVNKWIRGEIYPSIEDLETLEKITSDFNKNIEECIFSICKIIYSSKSYEEQKKVEEKRDECKELRDKIITLLFQHEKNYRQTDQTNQPISPKSQNQPSDKDNYPWGIIISMGVVIAFLLGIIIFLLVRKKNKKNE